MSEQGWRDFLAAEGVDDWVVIHGGATAVFRVGSLSEAAHLAAAVADADRLAGSVRLVAHPEVWRQPSGIFRSSCATYPAGAEPCLRASAPRVIIYFSPIIITLRHPSIRFLKLV